MRDFGMKCETGRNVLKPLHRVHGRPAFLTFSWSGRSLTSLRPSLPSLLQERYSRTVSRGHVDAHAPAFDGIEGVLGGEIVGFAAYDGGELDLVV